MPPTREVPTEETMTMKQFLANYANPLEGLEVLGLTNLYELIDAVDVRMESSAADTLVEALVMASSEYGVRDTWNWLRRISGLTKERVMNIITRRPRGDLEHHFRHVVAPNLPAGYRFQQLTLAWSIIENVDDGFLYGESLRSDQSRLDSTFDPYMPNAGSHELFWLCFHAALDGMAPEDLRKQAEDQARRLLDNNAWSLDQLWLDDPLFLDVAAGLAESILVIDDEDTDPRVAITSKDELVEEDLFSRAIRRRYGDEGHRKLY